MADQIGIVADPISDGSEESWILLDEMDEAMNEEFAAHVPEEYQSDSVDSTETLNQSNSIEVGNEVVPTISVTEDVDGASNIEMIPSNDDDEDDVDDNDNDTEDLCGITGNVTTYAYDESCDGFTTDGSISVLGDHEINHQGNFGSDDLSTHSPSSPPMQMWMRCTPIDMAICAQRTREIRSRNQSTDDEEFNASSPQTISSEFRNLLDNISREMLLLILTVSFFGILSIIYAQLISCRIELQELEQQLHKIKMEKYRVDENLVRCQYSYHMQTIKPTNSNAEFIPEKNNGDKEMPAVHIESVERDGTFVIKPTKLSDSRPMEEISENAPSKYSKHKIEQKKERKVWSGADHVAFYHEEEDDGYTSEIYKHSECNDRFSLFARKNREYCKKLKNLGREEPKIETPEKVYSTHYSYKAIDDKECNPNKIDFNLGIEHARKVLRDSNCDDEGTMKYLQKAYDNFQKKTNADHLKNRKESKKNEKSTEKWDKIETFDHSVKIEKYDTSEKYFDRNDKKDRRDKKQHKNSDKENKQRNDSKDAKKYHQDKDQGKWNKNERKRDTVKVHDHRHDN